MKFCMEYGDTNFIGVVNAKEYQSFVDEDWKLEALLEHFGSEMKQGNILVFQMTDEGIEYSWNVAVHIGTALEEQECYRKATGFIKVTDNQLHLVDYDCLTMSAQFEDEEVPDSNCLSYKIDIANGIYQVDIVQFYNVDQDNYFGTEKMDILLNFTKVPEFQPVLDEVLWCTY